MAIPINQKHQIPQIGTFNRLLSLFVHERSYECITGIMYAQTHIHVPRNKLIIARFCILMNLIFTYKFHETSQLSILMKSSSEGPDEPAHPRKIASALTAHKHIEGM